MAVLGRWWCSGFGVCGCQDRVFSCKLIRRGVGIVVRLCVVFNMGLV